MTLTSERAWMEQLQQQLTDASVLTHDAFWDAETGFVVTTDTLVEGVHFKLKREWTSPEDLGYKTAMVNLSDLAATLATPRWLTLNLSLPPDVTPDMLSAFYTGVQDALGTVNAMIIGGDTTASPHWVITATAIGHIPMGQAVGRRSGAQAGNGLYYRGSSPGLSGLGLWACQQNPENTSYSEARRTHHRPVAQTEAAKALQTLTTQNDLSVVTCIDTSDGLANAALLIAEASHVAIEIETRALPVHPELLAYRQQEGEEALTAVQYYGGEDYGLVCSLPLQLETELLSLGWQRIGSITALEEDESPYAEAINADNQKTRLTFELGFQHFSPSLSQQEAKNR
jgi:thiamine-monophosphate kinase